MTVHQGILEFLKCVASKGATVTYRNLGIRFGIPWHGHYLGSLLGEISESEVADGRPPLSSLVVQEETIGDSVCPKGYPAYGFLGCNFVPRGLADIDQAKGWMKTKQDETWSHYRGWICPGGLGDAVDRAIKAAL